MVSDEQRQRLIDGLNDSDFDDLLDDGPVTNVTPPSRTVTPPAQTTRNNVSTPHETPASARKRNVEDLFSEDDWEEDEVLQGTSRGDEIGQTNHVFNSPFASPEATRAMQMQLNRQQQSHSQGSPASPPKLARTRIPSESTDTFGAAPVGLTQSDVEIGQSDDECNGSTQPHTQVDETPPTVDSEEVHGPMLEAQRAEEDFIPLPSADPSEVPSQFDGLAPLRRKLLAEYDESVNLEPKQQQVVDAALNGNNVFFTGPAGSGKSFILAKIVKDLRSRYHEGVYVTSTTGLAAKNINGETLHRWGGLNPSMDGQNAAAIASRIMNNSNNGPLKRWQNANALVIDEVSMLEGEMFDKLNEVGKILRQKPQPFGGIQLILTGDFFQLPPVDQTVYHKGGWIKKHAKFAFEGQSWGATVDRVIVLDKIFRQDDAEFQAILNRLRMGDRSPEVIQFMQRLSKPKTYTDGIVPTKLSSKRGQVAVINERELRALKGLTLRFEARDHFDEETFDKVNHEERKKFSNSHFQMVECLELKIGAQVMLLVNSQDPDGLVNGSIGKVVAFSPNDFEAIQLLTDAVKEGNERFLSLYHQSLDPATHQNASELAQVYGIMEDIARLHNWFHDGGGLLYPIVQFTTGQIKFIANYNATMTSSDGSTTLASRDQTPLVHSWAISIHKSQGQTLDRVIVNLDEVFAYGQLYVALSRARSADALEVQHFKPQAIKVSPKVVEFYQNLSE